MLTECLRKFRENKTSGSKFQHMCKLNFTLYRPSLPAMNTMASSMINNVFGRGASGYFATFGLIAASYLTLKIALNVIKVLKSFVFAGSTNFKKLGSWAGKHVATSHCSAICCELP